MRTLKSPGVEWNEVDASAGIRPSVGTTALIAGFSDQGNSNEPMQINSVDSFTSNLGKPTTEAESYMYEAVREVIGAGGNVIASRIPYNNIIETNYNTTEININSGIDGTNIKSTDETLVGGIVVDIVNNNIVITKDVTVLDITEVGGANDIKGTLSTDGEYNLVMRKSGSIDIAFSRADDMNDGVYVDTINTNKLEYSIVAATGNTWQIKFEWVLGGVDYSSLRALTLDDDSGLYSMQAVVLETASSEMYKTGITALYVLEEKKGESITLETDVIAASSIITTAEKEKIYQFVDVLRPTDAELAQITTSAGKTAYEAIISNPVDLNNTATIECAKGVVKIKVDVDKSGYISNNKEVYGQLAGTFKIASGTDVATTPIEMVYTRNLDADINVNVSKTEGWSYSYTHAEKKVSLSFIGGNVTTFILTGTTSLALPRTHIDAVTPKIDVVYNAGEFNEEDLVLLSASGTAGMLPFTIDSSSRITTEEFNQIEAGGDISRFTQDADFLIVNTAKTTQSAMDEGYFTLVVDPMDAMYYQYTLDSERVIIDSFGHNTDNVYRKLDTSSLLFGDRVRESLSKAAASKFPLINWERDGNGLDTQSFQHIGVVLCRASSDADNNGRLAVSIVESYVGSIIRGAVNHASGASEYIGDKINNASSTLKFYSALKLDDAANIAGSFAWLAETKPLLFKKYGLATSYNNNYSYSSFTREESEKNIDAGGIIDALDLLFDKVSDIDKNDIDMVIDAGLSTIAEYTKNGMNKFDPERILAVGRITNSSSINYWRTVVTRMQSFCENRRKDCLVYIDAPRNMTLDGAVPYIRASVPKNTFSNIVAPAIKFITGLNSSYSTMDLVWISRISQVTKQPIWLPGSIAAAGLSVYRDTVGNVEDAPSGFNNGKVRDAIGLSIELTRGDADQLFTRSINYIRRYPYDGFIKESQLTTLANQTSSLSRINVRRLYLNIERSVYKMLRYYIGRPNNGLTRLQIKDQVEKYLSQIVTRGGLHKFEVMCDTTNNSDAVIQASELKVAVFLQAEILAEFIEATYINTPYGSDFSEYEIYAI